MNAHNNFSLSVLHKENCVIIYICISVEKIQKVYPKYPNF